MTTVVHDPAVAVAGTTTADRTVVGGAVSVTALAEELAGTPVIKPEAVVAIIRRCLDGGAGEADAGAVLVAVLSDPVAVPVVTKRMSAVALWRSKPQDEPTVAVGLARARLRVEGAILAAELQVATLIAEMRGRGEICVDGRVAARSGMPERLLKPL